MHIKARLAHIQVCFGELTQSGSSTETLEMSQITLLSMHHHHKITDQTDAGCILQYL